MIQGEQMVFLKLIKVLKINLKNFAQLNIVMWPADGKIFKAAQYSWMELIGSAVMWYFYTVNGNLLKLIIYLKL